MDQTLIKRSFHVHFSPIWNLLYLWYVLNYYLFQTKNIRKMLEYFSCSSKENALETLFSAGVWVCCCCLLILWFFFIFTLPFCTWFFLFDSFLSRPRSPAGVVFSVCLWSAWECPGPWEQLPSVAAVCGWVITLCTIPAALAPRRMDPWWVIPTCLCGSDLFALSLECFFCPARKTIRRQQSYDIFPPLNF